MSILSRIVRRPFDFIEYKINHVKMELKEELTDMVSKAIIYLAIAILAIFVILFASLGLANYLNVVLGSRFWGHLIVAAFYVLLATILFLLRKKNLILDKSRHYSEVMIKGKHLKKF